MSEFGLSWSHDTTLDGSDRIGGTITDLMTSGSGIFRWFTEPGKNMPMHVLCSERDVLFPPVDLRVEVVKPRHAKDGIVTRERK